MEINMKGKRAEILLYEDIGGFFGVTADSFIREVKSLGNIDVINLRINSNGGNVFDGVAIYNYLRGLQTRIEVDIDSMAASIASIIAMAGDEVRIADNAWLMIHDPWIMTGGTANELRKTAETMDGIRETLLNTYMHRAKSSVELISEMMTEETWLNANDALEHGLVDKITGAMAVAASVKKEWFKNPPQSLVERSKNTTNAKVLLSKMKQRVTAQNLKASRPGVK